MTDDRQTTPEEIPEEQWTSGEEVRSDVGAALATLRDLHAPTGIALAEGGALGPGPESGLLALPQAIRVVDLLPYLNARLPRPRRSRGEHIAHDVPSFRDLVERLGVGSTVIFADVAADRSRAALVAVLDFDDVTEDHETRPAWREHRVRYDFPLSREWRRWIVEAPTRPMSGVQLAELLEEHLPDVLDPATLSKDGATTRIAAQVGLQLGTPTALLDVARGLQVNVDAKVAQAVKLSTGEVRVAYDEAHTTSKAGAPVTVPSAFAIGIPAFEGGVRYTVLVRLRYRLTQDRSIAWTLLPHRAPETFDAAIADTIGSVVDLATVVRGAAPAKATP